MYLLLSHRNLDGVFCCWAVAERYKRPSLARSQPSVVLKELRAFLVSMRSWVRASLGTTFFFHFSIISLSFIFYKHFYYFFIINTFCSDKLYILTISISKTSNKIRLTSYYYKLLFWDTYIFLFHWSLTEVSTV